MEQAGPPAMPERPPLGKGSQAKVIRVEGLTLWIQADPITQEESHVG